MKVDVKRIGAFTASLLTVGTLALSGVAAADGMPGWGGGFDHDFDRDDMHQRLDVDRRFDFDRDHNFDQFNRFNSRISNMNDVRIDNTNDQFAQSGDAAVFGNRFGGNAVTGNAINNNDAAFNVGIRNY